MKTIKVKFVDFWAGFKENVLSKSNFFLCLKKRYKVVIDEENPDYIFYSVFGNEHKKYSNAIKIFYTGECVSPDFNYCDYAIGFDYVEFGDRYLRWPIYLFNWYKDGLTKRIEYKKTKFCSFVVSNNFAVCKEREVFFNLLSKYKKVDSGGRFLNNVGGPVKDKIEFIKQYKFNICFENQPYKGYITEKIIHSFYAGCIPIYYGAEDISEWFNEKAFINCNKYNSFNDVIERIKEIDNNDNIRLSMLKEPILAKPIEDKLEEFLYHIFDQDLEKARRRPRIFIYSSLNNDVKKENTFEISKEPKIKKNTKIKKIISKIKNKIFK